jgi:hypothetical protein
MTNEQLDMKMSSISTTFEEIADELLERLTLDALTLDEDTFTERKTQYKYLSTLKQTFINTTAGE